jgi:hypothetical protein
MRESFKRAQEQDAREVELLYSTKPRRVFLGPRQFNVPANYFGSKQRDEPSSFDATEHGFGFVLFLPDFGGYTKANWQDPFDRRRIDVLWVRLVDRNAMVPSTDGTYGPPTPASYGEPQARFANLRAFLEAQASLKMYGLEGYRRRGSGEKRVTWTGYRANGEFFFFDSTTAPGQTVPQWMNPLCTTQYYSAAEDLHVAYRYSQDHIEKWREIDDAIWAKIGAWRVKS